LITIEENPILVARARTCFDILTKAGEHADEFDSIPEGLLVLLYSLVFVSKQYGVSATQLTSSIKSIRGIIERAQSIVGKESGIREVVTEAGLIQGN
jgi:hypothetical protein